MKTALLNYIRKHAKSTRKLLWLPASKSRDQRSYMHGIGAAKTKNGDNIVFFCSSGLPPQGAGKSSMWTHDVYMARWDNAAKTLGKPAVFIHKPGAQEPVSVAQAANGNIMVTVEDSWHAVPEPTCQRYGVYDADLQPVSPYPLDVAIGGHSGHVAASGNNFVVFYSRGWIRGGGVENLGSGNGVYAAVYDHGGRLIRKIDVAPDSREWWPIVAGAPKRVLLVWQKFIEGKSAELKIAMLEPESGVISGLKTLHPQIEYYSYNAAYSATAGRFLVTGTDAAKRGFAFLIDIDGNIAAGPIEIPPTVREAAISMHGNVAYVPCADNSLVKLEIGASTLLVAATQQLPISWSQLGSLGLIIGQSEIAFLSLSKTGLQETALSLR